MTHHVQNPHATDELVIILETTNPATAAVVESILEEEGITFNLRGESQQEMIVLPFTAPIRVQVLKKDEARARELLKDIE
jgi:hypothetical protein